MKKGFTLIELLAVIVILAVISLITVPMLLNVVEESRKGAFKVTCNEIYDAYEDYKIKEEINGNNNSQIIFEFNSDRTETEEINGIIYEPISKLSLKGELPKFGTYEIKDGKRELVVDNGKYTCVRNENRNDILDGALADNDLTAPVVRELVLSSTTKSIKVIVDGYEEDGLITKYYYQINNGEVVQSDINVYVFDNLNTKEEYEIKVYVENKSGLKSEVISKKIETKEISGTTYEESYTETEYEYVTSKTVQIKYDSQEGLNYYVKTDVEAEVVSGIIEECGLDTEPGSCTSTSVTVLEPNKWYRTKESTTSILFKQEGNIYTIVSDGTNTSSENTYEVVKVSDEVPTAPTITGEDESWSTEAKTISVAIDSTGAGGVKNYQYCVSAISTECNGEWINLEEGIIHAVISENGTNYTFFRAIGQNGKEGEISNPQTTMVDTSDPTVTVSVSGKVATFTVSDNIGVVAYGVNQSEESEPIYTEITEQSVDFTATSAGNYVVWVKDVAGRIAKAQFTIASSAFCAYNAGQVWNFAYNGTTGANGSVQSFNVPCAGTYKLEVWGAQGGTIGGAGGKGGYSYGNKTLTSGTTLYVVVGGAGIAPQISSENTSTLNVAGGYNGGGKASGKYPSSGKGHAGASGGGATHIATRTGLLSSLSSYKSDILIVAGGGGGGGQTLGWWGDNYAWKVLNLYAGAGGGTVGGTAQSDEYEVYGTGGTQTSGGTCNKYGDSYPALKGTFGKGGDTVDRCGGGGGGYYGGGAGWSGNGGGGGSGYIGGVTGGNMSNGQRTGHGYARITLVSITQ